MISTRVGAPDLPVAPAGALALAEGRLGFGRGVTVASELTI
jgi:hypothetical protein